MRRVIQAVLVPDEATGESVQLEQSLPVGVIARQARDLQSQNDTGVAERDLADQMLKAIAVISVFPEDTQVVVDDVNALVRPPERDCAITQGVLTLGALDVLQDLPWC